MCVFPISHRAGEDTGFPIRTRAAETRRNQGARLRQTPHERDSRGEAQDSAEAGECLPTGQELGTTARAGPARQGRAGRRLGQPQTQGGTASSTDRAQSRSPGDSQKSQRLFPRGGACLVLLYGALSVAHVVPKSLQSPSFSSQCQGPYWHSLCGTISSVCSTKAWV